MNVRGYNPGLGKPTLSIATGGFGDGKSAFFVWLATEMAREAGVQLWTNFACRGARYVTNIDELYEIEDAIILFDEVHDIADSRRSTSKGNMQFLRWHGQSRKTGCQIFLISQSGGKVDVRIRDMNDFEFACQDIGDDDAGDYRSLIKVYDVDTGRQINEFVFDRSMAFGRYNHRSRAWSLDEGTSAQALGLSSSGYEQALTMGWEEDDEEVAQWLRA